MDAEAEQFLQALQAEAATFTQAVAMDNGDWTVKGFIDVYRHVYTISVDTKLVSKVLELLLIPKLAEFGARNGYQLILAPEQNFYPDISFVAPETGHKFAVDIKSSYRVNAESVNGMTLGAFTGYFRNRTSRKNTTFPYADYAAHIVLGAIYSKTTMPIDEQHVHELEELTTISSVARDFVFFAQPKYLIASSRPGSGNTSNIGSVTQISQLLEGTGPFEQQGEAVYDDYWMFYLTKDMARKAGVPRPYTDLKSYQDYKSIGGQLSTEEVAMIEQRDTGLPESEEPESEERESEETE